MKTEVLIDELDNILREVGSVLLCLQRNGKLNGRWLGTQFKSEADLMAEKMIMQGLRKLPLDLPIISEEDATSHTLKTSSQYWLIDPIDGTASFCEGYSGFVSQIALMENNQPVLALVYAPYLDLMYVARRGRGAKLNGKNLIVNSYKKDLILIDNYPQPTGIANRLYKSLPCYDYLESGSIGLKICRIADGQADLFVKNVEVKNWDLAPGHLIISEAGGVMVDLSGSDIRYDRNLKQTNGFIATTSKKLLDEVITLLN